MWRYYSMVYGAYALGQPTGSCGKDLRRTRLTHGSIHRVRIYHVLMWPISTSRRCCLTTFLPLRRVYCTSSEYIGGIITPGDSVAYLGGFPCLGKGGDHTRTSSVSSLATTYTASEHIAGTNEYKRAHVASNGRVRQRTNAETD